MARSAPYLPPPIRGSCTSPARRPTAICGPAISSFGRRKARMKFFVSCWLLFALAASGCQDKPSLRTPADAEAEIKANLALLGPEDQRLAEQQKYCFIMDSVRLCEMGRPCKVSVQCQSAFVCCETCLQAAQENPDRALAQ